MELLSFVGSFFKEWTLYKPAISRPCNAERYFIGIGFRGYTESAQAFFDGLQRDLATKSVGDLESLVGEQAPESFDHIQVFQNETETLQINTIKKAISLNMEDRHTYWRDSYLASEEWCRHFKVRWRETLRVMTSPMY